MFNELEVRTIKWTEFYEVKHRFQDMFAGFENRLGKIEAKMEQERGKGKASRRIENKPRERGNSKASGGIENKPRKKKKINRY